MNFSSINIQKSDDRSVSSRSLDAINNSWKLEKVVDERGKTNYKLITSDSKSVSSDSMRARRHQAKHGKKTEHKSIGAFGVPGANAYMNNKATTLQSGIIKSIKRIPTVHKTTKHRDYEDETEKSVMKMEWVDQTIERFGERSGSLDKNMIIGNDKNLIEYNNANDLLQKSYHHGHLITNNTSIKNLNILLSYFGSQPIPLLTISVWSQILSPHIELINILSIPIHNLQSNKGKLITKELNTDIIPKGQIFITLNLQDRQEGYFNIKYNLEVTQVIHSFKNEDVNFEFPDFFSSSYPVSSRGYKVNQEQESELDYKIKQEILGVEEEILGGDEEEESVMEEPLPPVQVQDLPKLSNTSIFGDFIKKTENNIPIFGKKKIVPETEEDGSQFSFMNSNTYAAQGRSAAGIIPDVNEEVEFTEKDENDINNILHLLRNQQY
jgi:hypothetical protein